MGAFLVLQDFKSVVTAGYGQYLKGSHNTPDQLDRRPCPRPHLILVFTSRTREHSRIARFRQELRERRVCTAYN